MEADESQFVANSIAFTLYSSEEVDELSVLEITNPQTFDLIGQPQNNGLYDNKLGPSNNNESCGTCHLGFVNCPGHVGHITLPLVVFHPMFFKELVKLAKGICFNCHRLLAPSHFSELLLAQLHVLKFGLVGASQELQELVTEELSASEGAGDSVMLSALLKTKIEEYMDKLNLNDEDILRAGRHCVVKNVMEVRQRLVKQFIATHMTRSYKKCAHCKNRKAGIAVRDNVQLICSFKDEQPAAKVDKKKPESLDESEFIIEEEEAMEKKIEGKRETEDRQTLLIPTEVRKHFRALWDNQKELLKYLFGILNNAPKSRVCCPTDCFFLDVILVPPPKFRPMMCMNGKKFEHPVTGVYRRVMEHCQQLRHILVLLNNKQKSTTEISELELNRITFAVSQYQGGETMEDKMHFAWRQLQVAVTSIFDSESDKLAKSKGAPGIRQVLEKKEGLFRKFMMGKRVNYAARSVISPDPYIGVHEIGIPMIFAMGLSYPTPVTTRNVAEMRRAVINGPKKYPGALCVELESGAIMRLSDDAPGNREALAKQLLTPSPQWENRPKIVHRHLQTGDVLLLNRQPTLHKPGIMAHQARVLPNERTLRLHYANCKCYNADFDGDEMNAHFPQSELARAEAYNIANVTNQYLVPRDGSPLSGLIQDHVIAGSLLSMRGRFFDRDDYNLLSFTALSFLNKRIRTVAPSMIKPRVLWSGKQIISTIIINCIPEDVPCINIEGKAKIPAKAWASSSSDVSFPHMGEDAVIIRGGELLCGILDKAHYGPTQYGLVHACYELYGGEISGRLLTSFARLFTHYLQMCSGFTLGIRDILVLPSADKKRRRIMRRGTKDGFNIARKALDMTEDEGSDELIKSKLQNGHLARTDAFLKRWDSSMKQHTDEINNKINKVCIPEGLLCKFPDNGLQLMVQSGAKGGMVNCMQISCLLGQIELEGRRVPLMASGRTLPSFRPYDTTPRAGGFIDGRFLTGIRPQEFFFHCMAGREGLVDTAVKTSRSGYLQRCLVKHLEGLVVSYDQTVRDSDGSVVQYMYGEDGFDILKSQMINAKGFSIMASNPNAVRQHQLPDELFAQKSRIKKHKKKVNRWMEACAAYGDKHIRVPHESQDETLQRLKRTPEPLNHAFRSDLCFGVISENLDVLINDYIAKNPGRLISNDDADGNKSSGGVSADEFRHLVHYKSQHALANPGEPVGLLAAQSIGEPSTQMTLNTFHFAGRGEMNVTLGIPRMREILMVASANIATPSMTLHLLPGENVLKKAERLRIYATAVHLKELVEHVTVREKLDVNHPRDKFRVYHVRFQFLPYKAYRSSLYATPARILRFMERPFIAQFTIALKKAFALSRAARAVSSVREVVKSVMDQRESEDGPTKHGGGGGLGGDSEDDEDEEGVTPESDSTALRHHNKHQDDLEYDESDEDEAPDDDMNVDMDESTVSHSEENEEESSMLVAEAVAISAADKKREDLIKSKAARIHAVLEVSKLLSEYDFDTEEEEWCSYTFKVPLNQPRVDIASLIEELCNKCVFHQLPGIKRAFLVKENDDKSGCGKSLRMEGVNFREMSKHDDVLDMRRIYSNDIHSIARVLGIEAATKAIVREVSGVFAVYGIEVNPRHLSLVADYMTFDGTYRAYNRTHMENSSSPLQQMTFETTVGFLRNAALLGISDYLQSPSAKLVMGQVVQVGTGLSQMKSNFRLCATTTPTTTDNSMMIASA